MPDEKSRDSERRRTYGQRRRRESWSRDRADVVAEGALALLGGVLTADFDSWLGIFRGAGGGVLALLLYEFGFRPVRHYIWTAPTDFHLKELEKQDALVKAHGLEMAAVRAKEAALKAQSEKHIRFTYGYAALIPHIGDKLRDATEVLVVFTRCMLRNPDERGTSVLFSLFLEEAPNVSFSFEPEPTISKNAIDVVQKSSGAVFEDLFIHVENINPRTIRPGWLVFSFNQPILRRLETFDPSGCRLLLEAKDGISGHIETWNATGTLMRLLTKRGILPTLPKTDGPSAP
jgi:hypothetical protein